MSSAAINTVIKMMESLPEDKQDDVVEHLQEYIQDLQYEQKWHKSFDKSQDKLITDVNLARQQMTSKNINLPEIQKKLDSTIQENYQIDITVIFNKVS